MKIQWYTPVLINVFHCMKKDRFIQNIDTQTQHKNIKYGSDTSFCNDSITDTIYKYFNEFEMDFFLQNEKF